MQPGCRVAYTADDSVQHQERDAAEQQSVLADLQQRVTVQEAAAQQAQKQLTAQEQQTRLVRPADGHAC